MKRSFPPSSPSIISWCTLRKNDHPHHYGTETTNAMDLFASDAHWLEPRSHTVEKTVDTHNERGKAALKRRHVENAPNSQRFSSSRMSSTSAVATLDKHRNTQQPKSQCYRHDSPRKQTLLSFLDDSTDDDDDDDDSILEGAPVFRKRPLAQQPPLAAAPSTKSRIGSSKDEPIVLDLSSDSDTTSVAASHSHSSSLLGDLEDDDSCWPMHVPPALYSWQEFRTIVYEMVRTMIPSERRGDDELMDAIESKGICREANHDIQKKIKKYQHDDATIAQKNAQYGRVVFPAVDKLFGPEYLDLQPSDTFLDLGHGSGLPNLQAAYTVGCRSIGIELDTSRYMLSSEFQYMFRHELQAIQNRALPCRQGQAPPIAGSVELVQGSFHDLRLRDFLTNSRGTTKCLVNNFNGVFANQAEGTLNVYSPDDFIAGLFALMRPGSIMITLHPLNMGSTSSLKEATKHRTKHKLPPHLNASFYELDTDIAPLGLQKDTVSWSHGNGCKKPLRVYKYTRVGLSQFVCGNPDCPRHNDLQDATEVRTLKREKPTDETPMTSMSTVIRYCACGYNLRSSRQRNRTEQL